jgi:hypothetical protein
MIRCRAETLVCATLLGALVLALAGCPRRDGMRVIIDAQRLSASEVTAITELHVDVQLETAHVTQAYPLADELADDRETDFLLFFGDRSGEADILVIAVDASGVEVARGSAPAVALDRGGEVTVELLGGPAPDSGVADSGVADGGPADSGRLDSGASDSGTGDAGFPPPVLIVEVFVDSVAGVDGVELLNTSGADIDLDGYGLLYETSAGAFVSRTLPAQVVGAGARVLVLDATAADAGMPSPTIVLPSNIPWGMGSVGAAAVVDPSGVGIDFLRFGGSTMSPVTMAPGMVWTESTPLPSPGRDVTLSRMPEPTDTDDAADFCVAATTLLAPNGPCYSGSPDQLLVNEINMGTPDAIEIVNIGVEIDLRGHFLEWTSMSGDRGLWPLPAHILAAGGYAVLADGALAGAINLASWSNILWGPTSGRSGSVALFDPYRRAVDFVRFGISDELPPAPTNWTEADGGIPVAPDDATFIIRDESLPDSDDASDFCLTTTASLGSANPSCP